MEAMADLLNSTFGKTELAKIRKGKAAETYAARKALVDQIEAIEAERDATVADLSEKLKIATQRHDAAKTEFHAAMSNMNALRRQRASMAGSKARDVEKLRHELRKMADSKIGDFIRETYAMRNEVYGTESWENLRKTDRPGRAAWAVIAEIFSTKPSLESKIAAIDSAREMALELQVDAVEDVDSELQKIRDTIPGKDFSFAKIGETEIEV